MALRGSNSSSGGAARAACASAVARKTAAAAPTRLSSHQARSDDKRSVVVAAVGQVRDAPLDLRHRVRLDLRGPLRIDRVEPEQAGIESKVRHQHELAAEDQARRREEPERLTAPADPVEVSKLV